jgi:DNA-binding NarL/FixJ family response regulator
LADDHAVLRAGLRLLIEGTTGFAVVGEAENAADVARGVLESHAELLVLDLAMPGGGGLRALREVVALCPTTRVVILSMFDNRGFLRAALEAGARGYVTKKSADTDLLDALRAVMSGDVYVDRTLAPDVGAASTSVGSHISAPDEAGLKALSSREREVFDLLVAGHTNREIADSIGVGVKTVETYRARVLEKLGVKTRAELVRYAMSTGILSDGT